MITGDRIHLNIPFEAFYQAVNAMLAVRTLDVLRWEGNMLTECWGSQWDTTAEPVNSGFWNISNEQITAGIKKTRWPGRMEQAAPGIYLDGAHNPGGVDAFLETAKEIVERTGRRPYLLFGAVSDKDYRNMAAQLCSGLEWAAVGVVHINSDRGCRPMRCRRCLKAGLPVRLPPMRTPAAPGRDEGEKQRRAFVLRRLSLPDRGD